MTTATETTSPATVAGSNPEGVVMTVSLTAARDAAAATFASDERVTAVYYEASFGEIVVVRSGEVYLAAEYDLGLVGR